MDPITPYPEAVTAKILQSITEAGTTRNAVAQGAGMTRNLFDRRVACHGFTLPELDRVARALNLPVEHLSAPRRDAAAAA